MTNWVEHATFLSGQVVELIPLKKKHFPELEKLSKDKGIWEFYVLDGTNSEKFLEALKYCNC